MNSKETHIGEGSLYFENSLIDVFNTMVCCDIRIKCNGGQLFAHRAVLSSSSPFLKELLEDTSVAVLIMPEFEKPVVSKALEILYTGEIKLDTNTNETLIIQALNAFGIENSKLQQVEVEITPKYLPKLGRPRRSGSEIVKKKKTPVCVSSINNPKENPTITSLQGNQDQLKQYGSRSNARTRKRKRSNCEIMDPDSNSNTGTQQAPSDSIQKQKPTTFDHDYLELESCNVTVKTEIELTSYQNDDDLDDCSQENYDENTDKLKIHSIRSITPAEYQNIRKRKRQIVEEEKDDEGEETEQEKIESARVSSQKDHAYYKKKKKKSFIEHSYSDYR